MAAKKKRFTAADAAELAELLSQSNETGAPLAPGVIEAAMKAAKPERIPKPKADPVVKRLSSLARDVANRHQHLTEARRFLSEHYVFSAARRAQFRANGFKAPELTLDERIQARQLEDKADSFAADMPRLQSDFLRLSAVLAEAVLSYFSPELPHEQN